MIINNKALLKLFTENKMPFTRTHNIEISGGEREDRYVVSFVNDGIGYDDEFDTDKDEAALANRMSKSIEDWFDKHKINCKSLGWVWSLDAGFTSPDADSYPLYWTAIITITPENIERLS